MPEQFECSAPFTVSDLMTSALGGQMTGTCGFLETRMSWGPKLPALNCWATSQTTVLSKGVVKGSEKGKYLQYSVIRPRASGAGRDFCVCPGNLIWRGRGMGKSLRHRSAPIPLTLLRFA